MVAPVNMRHLELNLTMHPTYPKTYTIGHRVENHLLGRLVGNLRIIRMPNAHIWVRILIMILSCLQYAQNIIFFDGTYLYDK